MKRSLSLRDRSEELLVYYAAVVHRKTILGAHSIVEEDYMSVVAEAMGQLPPNLSRYSRVSAWLHACIVTCCQSILQGEC